jgi:hypothetical protein
MKYIILCAVLILTSCITSLHNSQAVLPSGFVEEIKSRGGEIHGDWAVYEEEKDLFTDEVSRTIITLAIEKPKDLYYTPALTIRCDPSLGLYVAINFEAHIDSDFFVLQYRFDKEEVRTTTLVTGTNGTSGFFYTNSIPDLNELINQIKTHSTLVVRRDYDEEDQTISFSLRGAEKAIGKLPCVE